MTVEDQRVAHDGMGVAVRKCLGIFYSDDGIVVYQDPECLQGALNVLVNLFRQYRLVMNVAKSKAMTFHLGALWYGMS